MSARRASTTELRPATISELGLPRRPLLVGRLLPGRPEPADRPPEEPGRPPEEGRPPEAGRAAYLPPEPEPPELEPPKPEPPEPPPCPESAGRWLRLWAMCFSRSAALGVGPLPSRPRRRWPPEPTVGPLPLLRTAPRRWELPAMSVLRLGNGRGAGRRVGVPGQRPSRAGRGVFDGDPCGGELIANSISGGEIPCRPG